MPYRDGRKRVGSPTSDSTDIFKRVDLWPATLMAGVAEGRLPRPTISMFLHVFTRFY
jgi:hypothetical protein